MSGQRQEKAYGTTLIVACQTKNYWFGLQIGDGKCVCISPDGSMGEPIPWDEDCQANITTSICDSEAIEEFRYYFTKKCPIATLMGTDGIDDSYANTEEMYVLYRSILAIFAEYGRETGEAEIEAFLPGLSRKGSGDDVSIAGIVSATLSMAFIEVLKAQCEYSNAKAQREQADREVTLAAEKQEYVLSAMKKAKMNYDLCVQKANEAQEAIEIAQRTREDALKRFEATEIALSSAVTAYQSSIASETADVAAENSDVHTDTDEDSTSNVSSANSSGVREGETANFEEASVLTGTDKADPVAGEDSTEVMVDLPSVEEIDSKDQGIIQ